MMIGSPIYGVAVFDDRYAPNNMVNYACASFQREGVYILSQKCRAV